MNQGALFRNDYQVGTVLGSCISVTFHYKHVLLAGMFHAQLPYREEAIHSTENVWRFVDSSIETMVGKLQACGAKRQHLEAKVFGGASMQHGVYSVGTRNIAAALDTLEKQRIRVVARNTGGTLGRKILFRTSTGEVLHQFLRSGMMVG